MPARATPASLNATPADVATSLKVPLPRFRYSLFGCVSFATNRSIHPSSSKSSIATPSPFEVGSCSPARRVDELAGTRISKQSIAAESRHVEIGAAVVVVVGGGSAKRVQLDAESRRRRHVGERAVAVVAIERETRFWACVPRPVRRVEEQDVLPAVAVGIEEQAAGPEGFGQVFAAERAVVVDESEAGRSGDVGERDRRWIPGGRAAGDGRGNDEECGDERTSHGIRIRLCSPAADAWAPGTVEPCAPSDVRES